MIQRIHKDARQEDNTSIEPAAHSEQAVGRHLKSVPQGYFAHRFSKQKLL